MPIFQVVVLALIQGVTEFLPVSSTAHLYLATWLTGWKAETLDFDIALHAGTLVAVLLYFSRDWIHILALGFGARPVYPDPFQQTPALLWLLALAALPVGAAGLLFHKRADSAWRNPYGMGGLLIAVGLFLWYAEASGHMARDLASLNLTDALSIGISQALAIVPGASRSGLTIGAGLLRNLDRESAARFSFLLSAPVVAAAAGKSLYGLHKAGRLKSVCNANFLVGAAVSAATGYVAIAWFLHYLRWGNLLPFVFYRIIFGIIVLALAFIRRPA